MQRKQVLVLINYLTLYFRSKLEDVRLYQLTDPVSHAECPTWDSRNNILYYVNIPQGQIFRYDYATKTQKSIKLNGEIAPVIPSKNNPNLLVAGLGRSVVAVEWDGSTQSETKTLTTVSEQFPNSKFNDGKADKQGRLWIGTMGTNGNGQGLLYEVTCEDLKDPIAVLEPVSISNGLAWNAANDKFYYIDSPTRQIVQYDFNDPDGTISNKKVIFDVNEHTDILGDPDGMTIDVDDNLWVALYGGSGVLHIDSQTGELLNTIEIPARDVTSTMWGGPDLDTLFVTTSRISLSGDDLLKWPAAGAVFAVTGLGTKGVPMYEVDLLESIDDQVCSLFII